MAEKYPFQIGDVVEAIDKFTANAPPRGSHGVVKALHENSIGVWFPGWSGGHDLTGRLDHRGGWYLLPSNLRLVEPEITPFSDEDFEKILA